MLSLIDQRMLLDLISGELIIEHDNVGTHELTCQLRFFLTLVHEVLDVHWLRVRLRVSVFRFDGVNVL